MKKLLSIILAVLMIVTTVPFAFAVECKHELVLDKDIKTSVSCNSCGQVIYASDSRWEIGTYEEDFADVNIARCEGYTNPTDEVVAYYVVETADGYEYDMSFDWAVNQGYIQYAQFILSLYHNDEEIITHDFTEEANPYKNIISEEYNYTAEGEIQVFKFVFKKVGRGNWTDMGRLVYLNDIEHSCREHFGGTATCAEKAKCNSCGVEYGGLLEHIDNDGDKICDNGGEQLICEDCGRPVHETIGVPQYICILISFIKLVVSFLNAVK